MGNEYDCPDLLINNLKDAYSSLEEAIYGSGEYEDEGDEIAHRIDKLRSQVWQIVVELDPTEGGDNAQQIP